MRLEVFVTGGTGYIGSRLVPLLLSRGHRVRALARPGSETTLPAGCEIVSGDALRTETFAERVAPADTFVQLVGVSHPSPAKPAQFRDVDLALAKASAEAAARAGVAHFVYVSVARPAPVMKAYQQARAEAEAFIASKARNATFLRPWYVLGPGHPVAVPALPRLPGRREAPCDPRVGPAPRPGHDRADAFRPGPRRREPAARDPHPPGARPARRGGVAVGPEPTRPSRPARAPSGGNPAKARRRAS